MPEICKRIEEFISDKSYDDVIECMECSIEEHRWGQDTQWRIDAETDSTPCDDSGRPFGIGGFIFLEEVTKREVLFFKVQMYNSFDKKITKQGYLKIHYNKANDKEFVKMLIQQTNIFLDQFYDHFIAGTEIFVPEWRRLKIEWEKEYK